MCVVITGCTTRFLDSSSIVSLASCYGTTSKSKVARQRRAVQAEKIDIFARYMYITYSVLPHRKRCKYVELLIYQSPAM